MASTRPSTVDSSTGFFSFRVISAAACALLLGAVGTPARALPPAQVIPVPGASTAVNFGSVYACPASSTLTPCSLTLTLTYGFSIDTTLDSISVVTQGASGLDFQFSNTTCAVTPSIIGANGTCTVDVTFAPLAPGLRMGAVQLIGDSGTVLATTFLQGIGQGPAVAFSPSLQNTISTGAYPLTSPQGVTVDAAGDVFIADPSYGFAVEIPAKNSATPFTVGAGLTAPTGVAVDGAGNVFIADNGGQQVVEIPAGGGSQFTIDTGLTYPYGVAVDGAGDLFVSDNSSGNVVEIPAGGGSPIPLALGLTNPTGLAVDAAGNVYVALDSAGQLAEIPARGGSPITLADGLNSPTGVAVDDAGDLFVTSGAAVVEIPATCTSPSCQTTVGTGITAAEGVAVDAIGNVFIADTVAAQVVEVLRSQPPSLAFPTTQFGTLSGPLSVLVRNVGNLPLNSVSIGLIIDPNFPQVLVGGTPADCTSSFSLTPGAGCNLSINFKPQSATSINGSAVFSDNALNASAATQSIALSGTATPGPQTISFAAIPSMVSPVVLSATASSGLPVTFTVSGPATLSYNLLTITGPGTVVVAADQAGSLNYLPATEITQTIVVGSPSAQTITFPAIPPQVMGGTNLVAVTASASSQLPTLLTSTTPSVCSVTGTAVSLLSFGQCSIQASQAGNAYFQSVGPVTQSFTVAQEVLGTTTLFFSSAAATGSVQVGFLPYPTSPSDFTATAPWTAAQSPYFVHMSLNGKPCVISQIIIGGVCQLFGTGPGVITFTLDANPSTQPRPVNIMLDNGQFLIIKQAGTGYIGANPLTTLQSIGFNNPNGVAIDGSGNVYIADSGNNAIKEWIPASALGPAQAAITLVSGLNNPTGAAVDGAGNVYIADTGNQAIEEWIAATNKLITLVPGLNQPEGIAVDRTGNVYFSDRGGNTVSEWNAATQTVLPNPLVSSGLLHPMGVAVDSDGNVYIADSGNNAIEEWSVATHQVTQLASGLNSPTTVAVDGSGNVYFGDAGNSTANPKVPPTIKEWSPSSQILNKPPVVTTLVPSGPAVPLTIPTGLAADAIGDVYVAGQNVVSEIPVAFLAPANYTVPATPTQITLFPLIPSTASLTGPFSPTTDQPAWIGISIFNGAVNLAVGSNVGNVARVGHVTVLGQVYTINQYGTGAAQTITFNKPADRPYSTATFTLSATASSGLAVSFNSQTPSVCTVSGSAVTMLSLGQCTIQATQAGSSPKWAAATPVNQSFNVTPGNQTIAFPAPPNTLLSAGPVTLTATASSNLPVSFASTTPAVCTVAANTASLLKTGTCTIQASQSGGGNYGPATSVNQSFFVATTAQTITFSALSPRALGTGTFTVSATATSKLAVSFNSQSTAVCTVSGSTVTLLAIGTCTIQATQAGNATYAAAPVVNQSFLVSQGSQTITFAAPPNRALSAGKFTVTATASSGLTVAFTSLTTATCTVSGTTVTLVAIGPCTIQASQAGNANYTAAAVVPQTFNVTSLTQTITFGALSSRVYGSGSFGLTATASSTLTVSFASTTTSVCTVSGATVSLVGAGTCTIQASQAGNTIYAAAPAVNQSFSVTKASQTITFAQLQPVTFSTTKSISLSATASSALTVSFASTTSTVCTVSGTTVTLKKTGTCTLQASQSGNGNYTAAPVITNTFSVQ